MTVLLKIGVVVVLLWLIIVIHFNVVDGFHLQQPLTVTKKIYNTHNNNNNKNNNNMNNNDQRGYITSSLLKTTSTILSMCICIDCARVTNCKAYHFVETKHNQPHMIENPTFMPRDGSPTIHVNVRSVKNNITDLVQRIKEEHEFEEEQAIKNDLNNNNKNNNNKNNNDNNEDDQDNKNNDEKPKLHGKTVYDVSSATTIEYDVVACGDFVEDKGCWVRNMPEEIKKANPNFVPT